MLFEQICAEAEGLDVFQPLGVRHSVERGPYKAEWNVNLSAVNYGADAPVWVLDVRLGPNHLRFEFSSRFGVNYCPRHKRLVFYQKDA